MINFIDPAGEREETNYWKPGSGILSVAAMLLFVVFVIGIALLGNRESISQQTQTGNTSQINAEEAATLMAREDALESREKIMANTEAALESREMAMMDREAGLKDLAGIRTVIINELTEKLSSLRLPVEINKVTGNIRFTETVLFGINNDTLNAEGQQYLKIFLPEYLSVLLSSKNEKYLDQIIIEGHADIDGSYWSNLFLSQSRANSVVNFILSQQLPEMSNGVSAVNYFTVSARSHNVPVVVDGVPNRSLSRRVEFVFRLKDDALLKQMQDLYRGEQ